MERFHVHRGRCRSRLRTEHPGSPVQELSLPGRDLVRVHVELLGQLGQRLLALHGSQGHLRLEGRGVVPARSSRHRLSLPAAIPAAVRQKLHSAPLSRFPEPALSEPGRERHHGSEWAGGNRPTATHAPPEAAIARLYALVEVLLYRPWEVLTDARLS